MNKKGLYMWGIMILIYILNTFHAVSLGGMRENLISEYSLTEGKFILLTNAFSYTYMFMQIPAGILIDKFGAKKVSSAGTIVSAMGTLVFALGFDYHMLVVGRALIGLGCSICFLSVLKICSEWFSESFFCTMSGITSFVGMIGAMLAQTPLAMLLRFFSWNKVFLGISVLTILIAFLIMLFVQDSPKKEIQTKERNTSILTAVVSILKNKNTWPPLIVYGCFYGTYLLITGFYGSSMIMLFYNYSVIQASRCILFTVLGCAIGSVIVGIVSDKLRNRRFIEFGTGCFFLLTWIILLFCIGKVSMIITYQIMFFIGFFSCAYAVCWSCVKEYNDIEYVGSSTSIANMGGYLGSILVPTIIGIIYSKAVVNVGQIKAYNSIIIGAIVINLIGLIFAWFVKETGGKNIYGK